MSVYLLLHCTAKVVYWTVRIPLCCAVFAVFLAMLSLLVAVGFAPAVVLLLCGNRHLGGFLEESSDIVHELRGFVSSVFRGLFS